MSNLNLDDLPKKGQIVTFKHRGASFQMTVVNARIRYGKIDAELTPVNGGGSFWVRYDLLNEDVSEKALEAVA